MNGSTFQASTIGHSVKSLAERIEMVMTATGCDYDTAVMFVEAALNPTSNEKG